jgi:hypothetical protein
MTLDPRGGVWVVLVGYTSHRPVVPDEHWTQCLIEAANAMDARTLAAQMVGTQVGEWMGRPHPEMVTSARIIGCLV